MDAMQEAAGADIMLLNNRHVECVYIFEKINIGMGKRELLLYQNESILCKS